MLFALNHVFAIIVSMCDYSCQIYTVLTDVHVYSIIIIIHTMSWMLWLSLGVSWDKGKTVTDSMYRYMYNVV